MKTWQVLLVMALLPLHAGAAADLSDKVWNHGAPDCASNRDPAIEVFAFDAATFILRQNKCVDVEAPFIYVLFGESTVAVLDTGATADAQQFPLYDVVRDLIARRADHASRAEPKILVMHTHSHGDHVAADVQFRDKPGVTLVEPTNEAVRKHFGFSSWPEGMATIDLGARQLTVMPAPGHQDESLAIYDSATRWLLTGDSVYPGRLYVLDWATYRASMRRLAEFAKANPVSAVMGAHIEMSRVPGKDFPMGSTFHPNEAPLPLTVDDLLLLDESLRAAGEKPRQITKDKFIVSPIGTLQRVLGRILKAIGFR